MFRKSQSQSRKRSRHQGEGGYILLTLLLFVALLTIFAAAIVPSLTQQIKRDREEELVHRGVQYSRAVRHYYKKFGRYPTRIEELESTNTIRFLRKRYKDPITGKDFKLLHQGEVQISFGAGIGGGGAGLNALAASAGITPQNGQSVGAAVAAAAAAAQGTTPSTGLNATDADSPDAPGTQVSGQPGQGNSDKGPSDTKVFGGGPIVGVVSTSKDASIRSFNKKDHYNQWQFIYDPSTDRGGLLMTPNQPPLNITNGQTGNGQPGNGQSGTAPAGPGMNSGTGGSSDQSFPAPPPPTGPPPDQEQ